MKPIKWLIDAKETIGTAYSVLNGLVIILGYIFGSLITSSKTLQNTLTAFIIISGMLAFMIMPEISKNINKNTIGKIRKKQVLQGVISIILFFLILLILKPDFAKRYDLLIKLNSFFISMLPYTNFILGALLGLFIYRVILFCNLFSPKLIAKIENG